MREGIDTSLLATSTQHPTGVSFVIHARSGERTIFAFRGANGHLQASEIPFEAIAQADQLYITSLSHGSAALLPSIAAHAKQHNIPVAINPGSSQLVHGALQLKESLKDIDILILNSDEARTFMISLISAEEGYRKVLGGREEHPVCPPGAAERVPRLLFEPTMYQNCLLSTQSFFREILSCGPKTVVITDGCFGVYAAHAGEVLFHPAVDTEVVDTLGAGDSFGSCFVASLAKGCSIGEAMRNGNINSASVISQFGAKPGLLSFEEIEKRAPAVPADALQVFAL